MRQQAVELALRVDPSLARDLAQDSVELEERRRLWLMIARKAASEGVSGRDVDVVSKVVSVLRDCGPDVLSIEDVSFNKRRVSHPFITLFWTSLLTYKNEHITCKLLLVGSSFPTRLCAD